MSLLSKLSKGLRQIAQPLLKNIPIIGPVASDIVGATLVNTTAAQRGERQPVPIFTQADVRSGAIQPRTVEMLRQGGFVPPGGQGLVPAIAAAGAAAGALVVRSVGGGAIKRTATGLISSITTSAGRKVTRKNAANLVKRVGLEVGALALGITAIEAAELLLQDSQTKRRRKGITGAQLATAKRVNCTVKRMAADLGVKAAPVRRRAACR